MFDSDILRAFILQHNGHQRGEGHGDSHQEWRHHGGQEAFGVSEGEHQLLTLQRHHGGMEAFGVSEGVASAPYSATQRWNEAANILMTDEEKGFGFTLNK